MTGFPLGQTVITRGALASLDNEAIQKALQRHASSDWGGVCEEDWSANDQALQDGTRLLSSYVSKSKQKFWVITEADRSATTVLLPEEY